MLLIRSVVRTLVGVWSCIGFDELEPSSVGVLFLCRDGLVRLDGDGDRNFMLVSSSLVDSMACGSESSTCSELLSFQAGEGDLLCFLCAGGEGQGEGSPFSQPESRISSPFSSVVYAFSEEPYIPNAEYLAPFGMVTSKASEGRCEIVQGLMVMSAVTSFSECFSTKLRLECASVSFLLREAPLLEPSEGSVGVLVLRAVGFEGLL